MKYATGTYITLNGERRKILSAHDSVRDVSQAEKYSDDWEIAYQDSYTVEVLERDGWKEEKAPWKPEMGEDYIFLSNTGTKTRTNWSNSYCDDERFTIGNCYDPDDQEAIDAAIERVKKAYKGTPS